MYPNHTHTHYKYARLPYANADLTTCHREVYCAGFKLFSSVTRNIKSFSNHTKVFSWHWKIISSFHAYPVKEFTEVENLWALFFNKDFFDTVTLLCIIRYY
jgi:hypothetical protein